MAKRKKYIIIGAVVSVLVLGSAALIVAGAKAHMCGKFSGERFHEHVLGRMDEKFDALNPTEEQRKAYESIRAEIKASMDACREKRKGFVEQFETELNSETPDPDKIAELANQKLDTMHALLSENIGRFAELYRILDDNQQKQVVERMKEKFASCAGRDT